MLLVLGLVNFLKFDNPKSKLIKIFDLKDVTPLFKIPSCVLILEKSKKTIYPVNRKEFFGKLDKFNVTWEIAQKNLVIKESKYKPVDRDRKKGNNPYSDKFFAGARLIPRAFWFIEIKKDPLMGYNPENPFVRTEHNSNAKEPWKNVILEGNIEQKFLFNTILGTNIIPFGNIERKLIFLPIKTPKIEIIKKQEMDKVNTKEYLRNIEELWNEKTLTKNNIYFIINFRNKLTNQNPQYQFKVLYIASGTYLTSTIVNCLQKKINSDNIEIETNGFVADVTTYYFETNNADEAYYLVAILNSRILNKLIKPLQSQGAFGPRDIHKLPLKFPIPKFNSTNIDHKKLVLLSKSCTKKVPKKN